MSAHCHVEDHHPMHSAADRKAALSWLLSECRQHGLRRTKALELLLDEMLERHDPLTLADLAACERLSTQCDQATVYRLLTRLERVGVLRRLGLHQRSAYYVLLLPDQHRDYLVCTACGQIECVAVPCGLEEMERQVMHKSGYTALYHELEFFGICPECKPA